MCYWATTGSGDQLTITGQLAVKDNNKLGVADMQSDYIVWHTIETKSIKLKNTNNKTTSIKYSLNIIKSK